MSKPTKQEIEDRLRSEYYIKHNRMEKMAKKSFILRKQKDLGDTQINKLIEKSRQKKIVERKLDTKSYFSWFYLGYFLHKNPDLPSFLLLQLNANIFTHPADTLRVRLQARHKTIDTAGYLTNNVEKVSLFKGIGYSYYIIALQASIYCCISKLTKLEFTNYEKKTTDLFNMLISDAVSAPLRYYLETKRSLLQMANTKINTSWVFRNYRKAIPSLLLRDFGFKTFFYFLYTENMDSEDISYSPFRVYAFATFFSSLLTAPLDLISSKIMTQKQVHYKNMVNCFKTVLREEGAGKFISGFSLRFLVFSIFGGINLLFFNDTYELFNSAFSLENIADL